VGEEPDLEKVVACEEPERLWVLGWGSQRAVT